MNDIITLKEAARIAKRDKSSLLKALKKARVKLGKQNIDNDEYRGQPTIVMQRADFDDFVKIKNQIKW